MSIIVIQLQGGLVQDVFVKGTGAPTKAVVVDEDTEGADDPLTYIGEDGDKHQACIHTQDISKLSKGCDMALAVKAYDKAHR